MSRGSSGGARQEVGAGATAGQCGWGGQGCGTVKVGGRGQSSPHGLGTCVVGRH